jgi:hypothetical protein
MQTFKNLTLPFFYQLNCRRDYFPFLLLVFLGFIYVLFCS